VSPSQPARARRLRMQAMWTARRAPAKINLALEVLGRRADGYHQLAAVSQTIEWGDLVAVDRTSGPAGGPDPASWPVAVTGAMAGGLAGDPGPNLVARAGAALAAAGRPPRGARLWLVKRIPVGSGLGGGSADAAAALRLLAPGLSEAELARVGARVGADVPFALLGGTARLGGVGDRVEPLPPPPPGWCVVAVLGAILTRAVFGCTEDADHTDGERVGRVAATLAAGGRLDPLWLGSGLEAAAWRAHPGLEAAARLLRTATAPAPWALTGSGGAYFSLQPDGAAAAAVAAAARAAVPSAIVQVTRTSWSPAARPAGSG